MRPADVPGRAEPITVRRFAKSPEARGTTIDWRLVGADFDAGLEDGQVWRAAAGAAPSGRLPSRCRSAFLKLTASACM